MPTKKINLGDMRKRSELALCPRSDNGRRVAVISGVQEQRVFCFRGGAQQCSLYSLLSTVVSVGASQAWKSRQELAG